MNSYAHPTSKIGLVWCDGVPITSERISQSLIHVSFVPVQIHIIEKHGKTWTKPENIVVSEPFKLQQRVPNDKNNTYKHHKCYNKK
ncbi:hypothetical protein CR532_01700 [Candidatus Borreliella tachyglossi]|uniref:Uncharacterized protein n=1 Tax=Candidatus Borreliella tachyglossi TaxID=1964448 RepID=A0A2S1LWR1_9SPIR|nr:hypothetical protein [Candidatus Borreliella tachyglossi]AWG42716.1 hypothetical protein CR532_01700 [Candidatus Borreliella tachyglossi]